MKKIVMVVSLVSAIALIAFTVFHVGVQEGVRRVIEESRMYLNGTHIEMHYNGDVYVHNMY